MDLKAWPPLCNEAVHTLVVVVHCGDEVLLLGVLDHVRPRWAPISVMAKGGQHCCEQGVHVAHDHGFSTSVDNIYFHTIVIASEGVMFWSISP